MLTEETKNKIIEIVNFGQPLKADQLFSSLSYLPGRAWALNTGQSIFPYERLVAYENELQEICMWNSEKYNFIHKGTPFYFAGALAFDIGDYERAAFYFDAALAEDIKNKPQSSTFDWENAAAYGVYTLNQNYGNEIVQHPVKIIRKAMVEGIGLYNIQLGKSLDLDTLINKFVEPNLRNAGYRALVHTLYTFVTEYRQRLGQLLLRSTEWGTLEPFIIHFLKGCLLYESLLKQVYPSHSKDTLARILKDEKGDLGYCTHGKDLIDLTSVYRKDIKSVINDLLPFLINEPKLDKCITTTYAIRNLSSHNLVWEQSFTPEVYKELYASIISSILNLIEIKLL
jgi:hypothetical protein